MELNILISHPHTHTTVAKAGINSVEKMLKGSSEYWPTATATTTKCYNIFCNQMYQVSSVSWHKWWILTHFLLLNDFIVFSSCGFIANGIDFACRALHCGNSPIARQNRKANQFRCLIYSKIARGRNTHNHSNVCLCSGCNQFWRSSLNNKSCVAKYLAYTNAQHIFRKYIASSAKLPPKHSIIINL